MFDTIRRAFSSAGYVYESAGSQCKPNDPNTGTKAIQAELLARVPGSTNLGLYNCRTVAGSRSLSLHSVWRAGDIGCPSQTSETAQGLAIVAFLTLYAKELQIQEITHAKKRWQVNKGWSAYNGSDPHWNHVHWSVTHWGAAQSADYVKSVFNSGVPAPGPSPMQKGQNMFFAKKSDSATVWLVVPGGKIGINTPAELAMNQKALADAGFNNKIVVFPINSDSNVGNFLDKLPTLA